MIKIEFEDKVLRIPSSWSDIKLRDYEKWFMQKYESQADYVQFVADVCQLDVNLLLESPTQLFEAVVNCIRFVFDADFPPSSTVEIGKEVYHIAISEKLSLAEWIDVDTTLSSNSDTQVSEVLAVLCRPIGEEYNLETADARKEIFRNLPCDKALPLVSFFLFRKKQFDEISNLYSEMMVEVNQFLKDTKTLDLSGDGIKRLPIWQRIRFTYLTKSLEKQLLKYSVSSSTK